MLTNKAVIRLTYTLVLTLLSVAVAGLVILLQSKERTYEDVSLETTSEAVPFPVGVDPIAQTITELDLFNENTQNIAQASSFEGDDFWDRIVQFFSRRDWYQNLASPVSRIVVIWPGERKEEVATNFKAILRWNEDERDEFVRLITTTEPVLTEGTFYPGKYVVHRGVTPEEMALLIQEQFKTDVLDRYTPEVERIVTLNQALTIASLLEREASDFDNMREISGVIWNRLFIDMPLQLDATLQYVRGSRPSEATWWPAPRPADKYLISPYNTYTNTGLPPAPISNPSAEAVLAALNPRITDCIYYFHDSQRNYHCSETYEEHVQKLKTAYGRGR